jgi:hypothetical protein
VTRAQLTRILYLKSARVAVDSACGVAKTVNDDAIGGNLAGLLRQVDHEIVRVDALRQGTGGERPSN